MNNRTMKRLKRLAKERGELLSDVVPASETKSPELVGLMRAAGMALMLHAEPGGIMWAVNREVLRRTRASRWKALAKKLWRERQR